MYSPDRVLALSLIAACLALSPGCEQDMANQPRYEPLEASSFFPDGMASRMPVAGTVARGQLQTDSALYAGTQNGELVTQIPLAAVAESMSLPGDHAAVAERLLQVGRQRFEIFCSPCHGRTGYGNGMVVARGFPAPPSYHIPRLREAPVGHIFDVSTRGFGRMPSYAKQTTAAERWAITAYVRTLQLSQHVEESELTPADRSALAGQGGLSP